MRFIIKIFILLFERHLVNILSVVVNVEQVQVVQFRYHLQRQVAKHKGQVYVEKIEAIKNRKSVRNQLRTIENLPIRINQFELITMV